ncbi:endonuclease III [Bacteroidales bacterium OttesenSCG-928-L03]|nr:endonuclease III [Bacteroidales bacterium OttesenSCG-928-L03]
MRKQERYNGIINWFQENQPDPVSELHYQNPFQLLVAVVLSAQCTDKLVNKVTPALFEAFPTPEVMAASNQETIYEYIRSVSYPNQKAKHLLGLSRKLMSDFNGEVPSTVKEIEQLPGAGHKTANVVASVIFNVPAIAVDTHVFRVANRIGLTLNSKTPEQTEKELTKHIPRELWSKAHHWLILHGRYVCQARRPKCEACGIQAYCKSFGKI